MWLRTILRGVLMLLAILGCYRLMVNSLDSGYAALLSTTSIVESRVEPADTAVKVAPADPGAHYTRGLALVNKNRLQEATAELRQAVQLRPHHYYQWLDLGLTLDRLDDQSGALAAFKESIRLAPAFAQPRWQFGNFLFRQGNYADAFSELRLGAKSDPALFRSLLDLAWVATSGDAVQTESLVSPQSSHQRWALANYFAHNGKDADAVRQLRQAGMPQDDADRLLAKDTVVALLANKDFNSARDAWAVTHAVQSEAKSSEQILNGNFVEPIPQNDPGFGWQLSQVPNLAVSVDPSGPASGGQSILLNLSGEIAPGMPLLYQFILVPAKTRYSLSFMTKTLELVSGAPPAVLVLDANSGKILGQSLVSTGTNAWKKNDVTFVTDDSSAAITLAVQRVSCNESPCPIFGKLWLGAFSLVKN